MYQGAILLLLLSLRGGNRVLERGGKHCRRELLEALPAKSTIWVSEDTFDHGSSRGASYTLAYRAY